MSWYERQLRERDYPSDLVIAFGHELALNGYLDEAAGISAKGILWDRRKNKRVDSGGVGIQVLPDYWVDRIGHLALLDSYVKMSLLGWLPPRLPVLLSPAELVANNAYLDYWRPFFLVESRPDAIQRLEPLVRILEDLYFPAAYIGPSGKACWWLKAAWAAQEQWEAEDRRPLLHLSDRDRERGLRALQKLGMPSDAWFVCLHIRESGFHRDKPGYPDQSYRDSDIRRCEMAIKSISNRGGWVIRMGDDQTRPLESTERVIDYAHSTAKSDWMDVFLCASCRFFIATNSGLAIVPSTFGVPSVAIDYTPLANELFVKNGCFIPKLYWLGQEQRYLTFAEAMAAPLGYSHRSETFAAYAIRDNSPEEIRDVIDEMMDRLDGNFSQTPEQQLLRKRYERIKQEHGIVNRAKIGTRFLEQHADLLGLGSSSEMPVVDMYATTAAALGVPPSDARSALQLGRIFMEMGVLEQASISLHEVLRKDPNHVEARSLLVSLKNAQAKGDRELLSFAHTCLRQFLSQ